MKISLLFCLLLIVFFLQPLTISGEDIYSHNDFTNNENSILYRDLDPAQEIVNARTLNAKVFRMDNGGLVYRIFTRPIHYIDTQGRLEDLGVICNCCPDWEIGESYSGYADGLFGEKNVCGQGASYIQVNEIYYYRGFVEFNTDVIPDTATIDSVELNLNCVQWPLSSETHDIWSMENRPSTSGGLTVYNDAANGNSYVSDYSGGSGWNSWELDSVACQDMENLLLEDWFAIGISDYYSSSASYTLLYECGTGWLDVKEPPGIKEIPDGEHPTVFSLSQNYPNPFTTTTTITLSLPGAQEHRSTGTQVEAVQLNVFDVSGKKVRQFILSTRVEWDGTDAQGNKVPTGTYFYQLDVGNKSITKRMTLIR